MILLECSECQQPGAAGVFITLAITCPTCRLSGFDSVVQILAQILAQPLRVH